jgi:hypothetical protein
MAGTFYTECRTIEEEKTKTILLLIVSANFIQDNTRMLYLRIK